MMIRGRLLLSVDTVVQGPKLHGPAPLLVR
jgi:hypothetical protein